MNIEIIQSDQDFHNLASEWNKLLTCCSASHVPFLRHEYLYAWWQTRGGGEWPDSKLSVVTGRRADGSLAGIAPLFQSRNLDGKLTLLLLGSIEISDYLDLIVHPEELDLFASALLDFLTQNDAPEWQVLDWYNILEGSPTLPALQSASEARGWVYRQEKLQHCPYIQLPGNWETYLSGIDKKQRHEIRRKLRRAEAYPVPVNWYIVETDKNLDAEIDSFLELMAMDPEKDEFLTDDMRLQMRKAIHAAYQENWLQLSFLEAGNKKVAGYLNFDYEDHIWVYNSGLDFRFSDLSPGWVLLGHLLKWANENGRKYFDFMRGDEDYKYRFGAIDRFVVRTSITRKIPEDA